MTKEKEFELWLSTRPQIVQEIGRRLPPWKRYEHKGHPGLGIYTLYSISEDGTITCNKVDFLGMHSRVFGMNPDDLVEIEDTK